MWSSDGDNSSKNDIESLNTDDVLSVIQKILRENVLKPYFDLKCDVFSNTFYLWNGILKTCSPQRNLVFSNANQSMEKIQCGNNANGALTYFRDLESESARFYGTLK